MKRKVFRITSTAGHNITKSAWNSAQRAVEALAKELAVANGADYHLTDKVSVRADAWSFSHGTRTWTNQKTGESVVFTIAQE